MRLQRSPGNDYETEPPPDTDLLDWYDGSLDALLTELQERGPAAPAYTWWPSDQTVGFWYRRMAQEAAVHRVDVQDAFDAATPIDDELAVDGIDEVLDRFLGGDWSDEPPEEWGGVDPAAGAGDTIAVRARDQVWRATLAPDTVTLAHEDGPASASVTGEPESLLLWLWGRRPDEIVTIEGDTAAIRAFRDRLRIATQ